MLPLKHQKGGRKLPALDLRDQMSDARPFLFFWVFLG